MSSAITETATWETAVIGPDGVDPRTAASVRTPLQDLANRTKFLKESFVDIKSALIAAGDDYSSTSFANFSSDPTMTFTDVAIGDKIVLQASGSFGASTFTADGSDPECTLRWLVGGVDIQASDGTPYALWGSTVGASGDARMMSALAAYTVAADAATLTAKLQIKCATGHTINTSSACYLVGTHYRIGA